MSLPPDWFTYEEARTTLAEHGSWPAIVSYEEKKRAVVELCNMPRPLRVIPVEPHDSRYWYYNGDELDSWLNASYSLYGLLVFAECVEYGSGIYHDLCSYHEKYEWEKGLPNTFHPDLYLYTEQDINHVREQIWWSTFTYTIGRSPYLPQYAWFDKTGSSTKELNLRLWLDLTSPSNHPHYFMLISTIQQIYYEVSSYMSENNLKWPFHPDYFTDMNGYMQLNQLFWSNDRTGLSTWPSVRQDLSQKLASESDPTTEVLLAALNLAVKKD